MFTCFIRYKIAPDKLDEFREYAHPWISLIRKYGGIHHGYFILGTDKDNLPSATFSFPGLGTEGPPDVAIANIVWPYLKMKSVRLQQSDSMRQNVLQATSERSWYRS